LERGDLPYEEPEPTTNSYQDRNDKFQIHAARITLIGIRVVGAPVFIGPSESKEISREYEEQDGKDKIYEGEDYDRKLNEDHKERQAEGDKELGSDRVSHITSRPR